MYATTDIIGKCEISLQMLRDQLKHEEWFDLDSGIEDAMREEPQSAGRVHMVLQWIFCRYKYFEQALQMVEKTLEEELQQRDNLQDHLKQYRSPFKKLLESNEIELDSDVEYDKKEI